MGTIKLLETIVKEFVTIVELLEQYKPIENDRLIIEREEFKNLLEKYAYMNYTMPCKTQDKKTARKVVINYQTYLVIKELYNS